jgi:hypothetical protein
MARPGRLAETAEDICFLLFDRASCITGAHLAVNDGFLSRPTPKGQGPS